MDVAMARLDPIAGRGGATMEKLKSFGGNIIRGPGPPDGNGFHFVTGPPVMPSYANWTDIWRGGWPAASP